MSKLAASALAVVLSVAVSCAERPVSSSDAFHQLLDAIARSEMTESFRVTITVAPGGRGVAYYHAPDRLLERWLSEGHTVPKGAPLDGSTAPAAIIVGSRMFIEDADRPGYFQEVPDDLPDSPPSPPGLPPPPPGVQEPDISASGPTPSDPPPPAQPARAAAPLPGLSAVSAGAKNVKATASGFRFDMDYARYLRGTAKVRAGRIVEITLYAKGERTHFAYDLFGRAPEVTAPPANRLVPYAPLATCESDGNPPTRSPSGQVVFCEP